MLPVITVTVNPCIDISVHVPALLPDKKLYCTGLKKEPGGGGINVSRVIQRFGGETKALYLAGGYTGSFFTKMLEAENVNSICIATANDTRENFVVTEDATHLQYRLGMPGQAIAVAEWETVLRSLLQIDAFSFIVASGSLANGVPADFFARIGEIAKQKKAKYILDTSGEPLKAALNSGLFMIKPNMGELAKLVGCTELNMDTAVTAAREIIAKGQCEVIVVSMAASGALLVTESIVEHIMAPVVKIKSNVGAGDSMVAGIVYALSNGHKLSEAIRYGVACGSAATMNEGTALCLKDDADRLYHTFLKAE